MKKKQQPLLASENLKLLLVNFPHECIPCTAKNVNLTLNMNVCTWIFTFNFIIQLPQSTLEILSSSKHIENTKFYLNIFASRSIH